VRFNINDIVGTVIDNKHNTVSKNWFTIMTSVTSGNKTNYKIVSMHSYIIYNLSVYYYKSLIQNTNMSSFSNL